MMTWDDKTKVVSSAPWTHMLRSFEPSDDATELDPLISTVLEAKTVPAGCHKPIRCKTLGEIVLLTPDDAPTILSRPRRAPSKIVHRPVTVRALPRVSGALAGESAVSTRFQGFWLLTCLVIATFAVEACVLKLFA
jgi:hypothetical protein